MFLCLFYAVLDARASTVTYVSAGQEPGLLYRAATGDFVELRNMACPIGVVPDVPVDEPESFAMRPGDVLFLCTDGITEASNTDGEMFGRERLLDAIKAHATDGPQDMVAAILAEVESFRDGVPQQDDVTIVVVEAD